jgi:hypothetical protein
MIVTVLPKGAMIFFMGPAFFMFVADSFPVLQLDNFGSDTPICPTIFEDFGKKD